MAPAAHHAWPPPRSARSSGVLLAGWLRAGADPCLRVRVRGRSAAELLPHRLARDEAKTLVAAGLTTTEAARSNVSGVQCASLRIARKAARGHVADRRDIARRRRLPAEAVALEVLTGADGTAAKVDELPCEHDTPTECAAVRTLDRPGRIRDAELGAECGARPRHARARRAAAVRGRASTAFTRLVQAIGVS